MNPLPIPTRPEAVEGVLYASDDVVTPLVAKMLGDGPFRNATRSLGFVQAGKLVGGIVFEIDTPWGCNIAVAAKAFKWCTPRVLRRVGEFGFHYLDRKRGTARIAADNIRARKTIEHILGVTEPEGFHPRDYDGTRDLVTYGFLPENFARWIDQ